MKTRYNALHSVAMMLGLLLVGGVTGAWADLKKSEMGNDVCSPKIHFKLPDGWTNAYLMISGQGVPFPNPRLGGDGWAVLDLGSTKTNDDAYFFINGVNKNDCNDGLCVTRNGVNIKPNNARVEGFKCSDVGSEGEIWIQEHPDITKEGQVYVTTTKPVIKDFYIFLPDNTTWKSSTPVIDEDGKQHTLQVDNEHCGWYYRRYILDGKIDKALPSSVILYRDDDVNKDNAIGMGGEKAMNEGAAAEPIVLADLFSIFENEAGFEGALYFLADQKQADLLGNEDNYGWSISRPAGAEGNCSYDLAALIYDTDAELHPLFSCYAEGAQSGNDGCQKSTKSQDAIYKCIGVRQGLVESTLAIENGKKKMKLTAAGKTCFLDQGTFDQMFNMTKGVNEMSCYDMTFTRAKDGKWEFDSDYSPNEDLKTPVQGGFYPVEKTTDADILKADPSQTPVPKARTKRFAEGPVFYGPLLRANDPTEQIPKIDVYCNGPGWSKGFDCEGLFADGDGTTARINSDLKLGTVGQDACVFGWSCNDRGNAPEGWPFYTNGSEAKGTETGRWQSTEDAKSVNGGRNQHFCFESHANFRFKKGLKFNFRGDDDIWVFINNKLAVDLGGTHLAAPGYVDLDKFMPDGEVGKSYDIDIYFCDRRTTMSNVRIKTNMFIEQTTGIQADGKQDTKRFIETGDNLYKICYKESGGGSCAARVSGSGDKLQCGDQITKPITYVFARDKSGQDVVVNEDEFANKPVQYDGGIDVSKPYAPVINEDKLKSILPSGKYYLIIKIGSDTKAIEITIKGSVAVANREAVTIDGNGVRSLPYAFKSQAMASQLKDDGSPDIDQMIPLYIAPMLDPCNNAADCKDPLEMQLSPGSDYSLQVSNSKAVLYAMKDGKLTPFSPAANRKISEGGLDTIYVTIPYDEMVSAVENVTINVKGSNRKAELKFFVPRIVFVDSDSTFKVVTGDKNSDEPRMKGTVYEFYVVALNGDDSPCEECNFKLTQGSQTSEGLNVSYGELVNGRAKITLQSQKEYCRVGDGAKCTGAATLHVLGPNAALVQATYDNMVFDEPPVPYPLFADIFDVHGAVAANDVNVPTPYYSAEKEYLDGIGDSVVIYYHREFHKDSLPNNIAVFWESDNDSVLFEHEEIVKGAACGKAKGAETDSTCLARITLGGKKFSKDVKTSGRGVVKSWIKCAPRGVPVTLENSTNSLLDRIAPIIISARAVTDTADGKNAQLRITFSEPVAKTDQGAEEGDNVFSFYINAGKEHHFVDYIPVLSGVSYGKTLSAEPTILYSQTSEFPQAGDYIHFRGINGTGLVMDQSNYKTVTDSMQGAEALRPADESKYLWNVAPAYDSDPSVRVPSPWALITGAVNAYAVRLIPDAVGSIPLPPSEAAKLPDVEAFTFDAYKDESDFKKALINKDVNVDPNLANYGFVPHGWFIKSDMSALIVQDTTTQAAIGNNYASVYFDYELQFFTNLGSHVLTKKGRIYCDDKKNQEENKRHYFEGKNCVDKPKNFFIVWNMKSDKERLVGSGAYIAKLKTYVQLAKFGKKNKNDKTQMWGVRHNTKVIGSFNVENSK